MELWALFQTNPVVAYVVIAGLGLCVGSFLNVVIHRQPIILFEAWYDDLRPYGFFEKQPFFYPSGDHTPKTTLSTPASRCPKCGHLIRWYENIPVISWLVLRGQCSACHAPIGLRYPLVEIGTMLASLVVLMTFGATIQMWAALLLTWVLIALVGIDFDHQLLPDSLTLPLAGAGLLINAHHVFVSPTQAIWGYVIGFLVLWSVYILYKIITGKDGMGFGDFKLLAALGAWLGPTMLPLIVLLAATLGSIVGVILLRINKESRPFAFGPCLAIAGFIALLWGHEIVTSYATYAKIKIPL